MTWLPNMITSAQVDFRQIIIDELKDQGMTRRRLAELAGMTIPRVSDYLNARRDVQAETLRHMLEALGLEVRRTGGRPKGRTAKKGR